MTGMIKFYVMIVKFALILAFAGVLKEATIEVAGRAARAQRGLISYAKYTRALTSGAQKAVPPIRGSTKLIKK